MHPDRVTRTPTDGSAVLLPCVSVGIKLPVYCTAIGGSSGHGYGCIWNMEYPFLETGTSDRCLIGIVQCLEFSGSSLYYLSFFL